MRVVTTALAGSTGVLNGHHSHKSRQGISTHPCGGRRKFHEFKHRQNGEFYSRRRLWHQSNHTGWQHTNYFRRHRIEFSGQRHRHHHHQSGQHRSDSSCLHQCQHHSGRTRTYHSCQFCIYHRQW